MSAVPESLSLFTMLNMHTLCHIFELWQQHYPQHNARTCAPLVTTLCYVSSRRRLHHHHTARTCAHLAALVSCVSIACAHLDMTFACQRPQPQRQPNYNARTRPTPTITLRHASTPSRSHSRSPSSSHRSYVIITPLIHARSLRPSWHGTKSSGTKTQRKLECSGIACSRTSARASSAMCALHAAWIVLVHVWEKYTFKCVCVSVRA